MREQRGNMWTLHDNGSIVCVTTNGIIKSGGVAVMGRGVALSAAQRFPTLPKVLAACLTKYGNRVFYFGKINLITFPTKNDWRDKSDIELIKTSCTQLMEIINKYELKEVFLPRPGCANGGLNWADVKAHVAPLLDDRVVIISMDSSIDIMFEQEKNKNIAMLKKDMPY